MSPKLVDLSRIETPAGNSFISGDLDPFGEPQPHQQDFVAALFAGQDIICGHAMAGGLDPHQPGLRPLLGCGSMAIAIDVDPAVRAGPDAGVFLTAPVNQIMPALAAWPRVI